MFHCSENLGRRRFSTAYHCMDRAGKKVASGADFGRTKSSVAFRDRNNDGGNTRREGCSRLGCSSRHHSTDGATTRSSEKLKNSRTTLARSSRTESPIRVRKSKDKSILPSANRGGIVPGRRRQEDHTEETKSLERSEPLAVSASYHKGEIVGSSSASSNRDANPESDHASLGASSGSSNRNPIASSRNANRAFRARQGPSVDSQRYGLRNFGCRSNSPGNGARPEDALRRKNPKSQIPRWRITGGSSSSPRDTSTSPKPTTIPTPSIVRRHSTNCSSSSSSSSSSLNRSSSTTTTPNATTHRRERRMRLTEIEDDMFSLPAPLLTEQQLRLRSPLPDSPMARSSSRVAPIRSSCNGGGRGGSSTCGTRRRQDACTIDGSPEMEGDPFVERNGHHHINADGIAEVLLALDSIEQDDELSYEQQVMLETNLVFSGFSFYDQHRDLRLDIDNMSYEELLDLGQRMGTVDTALSDEQIAKSLTRFNFKSISPSSGSICNDDDSKCSICQEDYIEEDEVGKLICEHVYHVGCICQWFQLKNWCPICKSPAMSPSMKTNPQMGQTMLD